MQTRAAPDLRSQAADAWRRARAEPATVLKLAEPEPGRAWEAFSADPETAAIAHLAIGLAATEVQDLTGAREHFTDARELAAGAGLSKWLVEAEMNLALMLATTGELEQALVHLGDVLERAGPVPHATLAKVECQRALILQRLGRTDETLDAYRRGVAAFRQDGDRMGEAKVLINRGLLHAYAGRFEAADSDLRRAGRLCRAARQPLQAAYVRHNLGFVAARQGDIPAALRAYEGAARAMAGLGVNHPAALLDYCETLLRASLIGEAGQVGRAVVDQMETAGMETDLAEARLLLAEVSLAAGDLDEAEDLAVLAEDAFRSQCRPGWAVMARYAWLRVRWARGDRTPATTTAARSIGGELERSGWASAAGHARTLAARMALERGELAVAEAELATEAGRRRRAPADIRIQAWHAEALLRWSRGDGAGAQSALRAGLRVLTSYRAALGATELRVNAGHHGADLGHLAIHIALQRGEAERVLTWAERSRAATVRLTPVRPPADDVLTTRLAELRAVNEQLDEAARAGEADDTAGLLRRKAGLEDQIRRTTWHASGFQSGEAPSLSLKDLRRTLGPRVLVEYVESDNVLHAVAVRDGRSRLCRIGPLPGISREVESLRFSLDRLASARGARGSLAVMEQGFLRSAERLDGLLFGELRRTLGDRPLVVVPTGPLHLLPWHALPSCRGRAVSVAPSATVWLEAARREPPPGPVVLVAGPGVPQAVEEVDALAATYGNGVVRLAGAAATAKAVTGALDGAGLAHVAAHGTFRSDNPLFSSVRMADGPLTVYELERLSRAPGRVVLSSCNVGMSAVRPGDELLGLSSALFALGTTTLVASVLLVGDDQTRRLMVEFHRLLARGVDPPLALAQAQSACTAAGDDEDVRARASAWSFVCYGA